MRSPGPLSPRKGVNVTYARPELPAITEKDLADLELAARRAPTSSRSRSCARRRTSSCCARSMRELDCNARVIAKIEKVEAYEDLDEIIAVSDGVMVARGDYGVEAGVARVPLMQKDTIARATAPGQARHHRHADARVDDPVARADPRRGGRRRQRGDRRHLGGDALGRDERRPLPGRGRPGDGRRSPRPPRRRRRSTAARATSSRTRRPRRSCTPPSSSPTRSTPPRSSCPTSTGGAPRACAKYRPRRPLIVLAHRPGVCRAARARVGRVRRRGWSTPTPSTS